MNISLDVLRVVLNDGQRERPIFVGALSAETLSAIAEVPSFDSGTDQRVIAGNVLRPPIKDWQRPLNPIKRGAITTRFNQSGEFMPNPVLLSVGRRDLVSSSPKALNGQQTGLHALQIRTDGGPLPLWVLDGQHRIKGLAQSAQRRNPIPFVLLYSETPDVYKPEDSAKIFAEVSTEATPLSDLHREWLQFAFKLAHYNPNQPAPAGPQAVNHERSMATVAILCDRQEFDGGAIINPFFDRIQFNPERSAVPVHHHGFALTAPALKEWVYDEYYNKPAPSGGHQPPERVARELARAVMALIPSITTPPLQSAFFGEGSKRHQYIERGFVCAALSRLLVEPSPNWTALLDSLNFSSTDWDLSWVKSTGGSDGTTSKKIARDVFVEAFQAGALPNGVSDLVSYLRGDAATVYFTASHLTRGGRPASANKQAAHFPIGGVKVFHTGGRPHVMLERNHGHTANIGKLKIVDPSAPFGKEFSATKFRSGVTVDTAQELQIHAEYYGGWGEILKLTLKVV